MFSSLRRRFSNKGFQWASAWLISLVVFLFGGLLSYSAPLKALENLTYDWRFQVRGVRPLPVPITIIAIDQKTLDAPDLPPLVFWGERYAHAFRILRESGAKAIGFDLIQPLSLPHISLGANQPAPDQVEAQEIAVTPQLVLAFKRNVLPSGKVSETLPNVSFRTAMAMSGGGLGLANTLPDPDGVVRTFSPADSDGSPSFALEIARVASGQEPKLGKDSLSFGSRQVGLMPNGECIINYVGPDMTFPRISYADLLDHPATYRALIKDHICLIGTTSDELQDYHSAPFPTGKGLAPKLMAGVEINANTVSTLLTRSIWRGGPAVTWLCILLLVALSVPCCNALRITWVVPGLLALAATWTAVCMLAFIGRDWQLPLIPAITTMAANGILLIAARLREENARKKEVEGVFGRYVSPIVLEHLMNTPGAAELGGRRQVITCLFSDIRGFTSRSEQMEPEEVTRFLNLYLEKMVDVVFEHGGTIDKYMGDGIMAIWNWPTEQSDHALRAAKAALQMQREVEGAREQWHEMGFPVLAVGIGIHTGNAVLGNIGSPMRMENTAIGDTVNVASRLESLTKEMSKTLGSSILISESVRNAIQGEEGETVKPGFDFLPAGDTSIRGRMDTMKLYAIIPEKPEKLQEDASC